MTTTTAREGSRSLWSAIVRAQPLRVILVGLTLFVLVGAIWTVLARETAYDPGRLLRDFGRTAFRFLRAQQFVVLFLSVAGGYSLARVKVRGVSLGATASTMLLAIGVSVLGSAAYDVNFQLPDSIGSLFLNLFMFALGMKVGPQVLLGLRRGGLGGISLAILVPALSTGLMLLIRKVLSVPPGIVVGIFAGANTATPGLGAAKTAFASGAASHVGNAAVAESNMATAFAFSYCVSTVLFVVLLKLMPGWFGRDVVAEGRKFEEEVGGDGVPLPGTVGSLLPGTLPVVRRCYVLEKPNAVGHSLRELRLAFPRLDVQGVVRSGGLLPPDDDIVLELGDVVAVLGATELLLDLPGRLGHEVGDSRFPPLELETVEMVQRNDSILGRTLRDLASDVGHGIYLKALFRGGETLPRSPEITLEKGDILRVTGTPERIARLAEHVGPIVRPSIATDIYTLCLGLSLGAFVGALALPIGNIRLSLGAMALLLVGIVFSALRTRNPALGGPFPEPARRLLEDLGLNVFVAVLGLNAGLGVIRAIRLGAIGPILLSTLIVGLLPPIAAWVVGQYRLKMNAAELLGAVAGARSNAAGMVAAIEASRSNAPALAYPVTFAISNIIFTIVTYLLAVY